MNKVLFKLIEGKGRFFLGRNWPVWNPEKCHTNLQCESESERSKEQFCGCWNEYNRAINECISEALKNGEIVNPEVIVKGGTHGLLFTLGGKQIMDGDTFDLPEGMGFKKEIEWDTLQNYNPDSIPMGTAIASGTERIRLLPEKPVQKEESQEELWSKLSQIALDYTIGTNGMDTVGFEEEAKKQGFTIERKDS